MNVALDNKRRLRVPKRFAAVHPGDQFKVEFDADENTLVFRRIAKRNDWVSVLKACPLPMDDLDATLKRRRIRLPQWRNPAPPIVPSNRT
jgi:hypothetical protein